MSAEVYDIKPIEWEGVARNEPRGKTVAGICYYVAQDISDVWQAATLDGHRWSNKLGGFATMQAAMDACQADFKERIYSAIEWVP
jgi:hypothetical protein